MFTDEMMFRNCAERRSAAVIIRHCRKEQACAPGYPVSAYLRENVALERAALMLERKGYGSTFRSTTDGRGALCFRLK